VPAMSSEEAASIVARAIVQRPRTISPVWARLGLAATNLAQAPLEMALALYVRQVNPDSRRRAGIQPATTFGVLDAPVRVAEGAFRGITTVAGSRVLRPVRPDHLGRALLAFRRFGPTPAFVAAAAAELYGQRTAIIDEFGTVSFQELDQDSRRLAAALHERFGLGEDDRVAVMCRNHRGFVHAVVAASRLGCDLVPIGTDFSAAQLREVLDRESVTAAVCDAEFDELFAKAGFEGPRVVASDGAEGVSATVEEIIASSTGEPPLPSRHGRIVTLTSGTTGAPKGATRTIRLQSLIRMGIGGLLELPRINPAPRSGDTVLVAPPLFHLFGFVGLLAALGFGSPVVLRRRFDPEDALSEIERHQVGTVLAVPTMLARIMQLPEQTREHYDISSVRTVISGAAPLSPELARAVMDEFGDVLYNGYASTEVGAGTLATPADLRAAPGTVGRPTPGVTVKILDDEGDELPAGESGRVFVRSPLLFEGYTGGGTKQMIDGLMSTGDLGHLDEQGRLFIDGRDDDMIVSGGENVFPQEVEELLMSNDDVLDAAVFGVEDEDFGQRLAAYVVPRPGASITEEDLRTYVRERLARYKVPREVRFVEELPRTSTGKLQRRRLGELEPAR
jgi:fatty-acyl-CoA synthase